MSTEIAELSKDTNAFVKVLSLREGSAREKMNWIAGLTGGVDQVECPHTRKMLANRIYYGEQVIPSQTIIVGAVHKYEHFFMLLKGEMTLFTEDGLSYLKSPEIFVSRAGSKRIGYAHSDCIVANIERLEDWMSDSVDSLWDQLYAGTFDEYEDYLDSIREDACHLSD